MSELPRDEDGNIETSAIFGHEILVEIDWTTDADGREIDPGKEEYPKCLYGPFLSVDEAKQWMDAYPGFEEIHEMGTVFVNRVRPREGK